MPTGSSSDFADGTYHIKDRHTRLQDQSRPYSKEPEGQALWVWFIFSHMTVMNVLLSFPSSYWPWYLLLSRILAISIAFNGSVIASAIEDESCSASLETFSMVWILLMRERRGRADCGVDEDDADDHHTLGLIVRKECLSRPSISCPDVSYPGRVLRRVQDVDRSNHYFSFSHEFNS